MSKQTLTWMPGQDTRTWWKDHGIYKKHVRECSHVAGEGNTHIQKKNKTFNIIFDFVTGQEYSKGTFTPPVWDTDGNLLHPGQFTRTGSATESEYNQCWNTPEPQGPLVVNIGSLSVNPELIATEDINTPLDKDQQEIDWKMAVAIGIVLIAIVYYLIKK